MLSRDAASLEARVSLKALYRTNVDVYPLVTPNYYASNKLWNHLGAKVGDFLVVTYPFKNLSGSKDTAPFAKFPGGSFTFSWEFLNQIMLISFYYATCFGSLSVKNHHG